MSQSNSSSLGHHAVSHDVKCDQAFELNERRADIEM
jgi:hypothetical protein